MKYLSNYRFPIFLTTLLLVLYLWFIPAQRRLYLQSDFDLIIKIAQTVFIWATAFAVLIALIFALRSIRSVKVVLNILVGIAMILLLSYVFLKPVCTSLILGLNRISTKNLERKYTLTFSLVHGMPAPMIYDFNNRSILMDEKIAYNEKLDNFNSGDTIVISFKRGLLGVAFDPIIK